jgi:hypothetical protein
MYTFSYQITFDSLPRVTVQPFCYCHIHHEQQPHTLTAAFKRLNHLAVACNHESERQQEQCAHKSQPGWRSDHHKQSAKGTAEGDMTSLLPTCFQPMHCVQVLVSCSISKQSMFSTQDSR